MTQAIADVGSAVESPPVAVPLSSPYRVIRLVIAVPFSQCEPHFLQWFLGRIEDRANLQVPLIIVRSDRLTGRGIKDWYAQFQEGERHAHDPRLSMAAVDGFEVLAVTRAADVHRLSEMVGNGDFVDLKVLAAASDASEPVPEDILWSLGATDDYVPTVLDFEARVAPSPNREMETVSEVPRTDLSLIAGEIYPQIDGYHFLNRAAVGGQGSVYEALQTATGRRVAVKVLHDELPATLQRFDREVQALVRVDHPNIAPVLECGRAASGTPFFSMPFIDGMSVDQFAERLPKTQESTRKLINLFVRVAQAVGHLHLKGIVHRDLKTSNILVDSGGEPRVIDLGIATGQSYDDATFHTAVDGFVGSLTSCSPEQAGSEAGSVDSRTDIYAIGISMYRCLTGRYPHRLTGPLIEVFQEIRTRMPIPPTRVADASLPSDPALDAIVLKCLEKNPADRYVSGEMLAADLDAWVHGKRPSAPRRLRLWWRAIFRR